MSHSYYNIWIHCIFSTKNRHPLIQPDFEHQLYERIKKNAEELGCYPIYINGTENHIHLLFLQNPKKNLTEIIKQIKGETSYWLNQEHRTIKFGWQVGFAAFSVSESQLEIVKKYLRNQKEHHKKQSFDQEWKRFKKLHHYEDQ